MQPPHHSTHYPKDEERPGTQADEIAQEAVPVVEQALAVCRFPIARDALIDCVHGWRIPFRHAHIRPDLALAQVSQASFDDAHEAALAMYDSGALAAAVGSERRVKDHFQGGNA